MPYDFNADLNKKKHMVESALEEVLTVPECSYADVWRAMAYSTLGGGKRMRALLAIGFAECFGTQANTALPIACALEMVHAYSLIHDDLPCMDDDDFRRGKPSCHKAFDEAIALLAGDALLTHAFTTVLSAEGIDDAKKVKTTRVLSKAAGVGGMIGGQCIDIQNENTDKELLDEMHLLKTGALIRAAVGMGALCADATEAELRICDNYARVLGIAFQIQDDVLDVEGDESLLGKPTNSDEANEKTTYVTIYGTEKAKTMTKELFSKAFTLLNDIKELGRDTRFLENLTEMLMSRKY